MHEDLVSLFKRDSAVIMMSGHKEDGKTDFSLRMGEDAMELGLIARMASNIKTDDERCDHITNYYDLENWLMVKGRKYFIFDEAGKHISRMRFMAQMNKMIIDIIQLVRHYDATFTAIAPTEKLIDSRFLGSELLDCRIRKINKKFAEVRNKLSRQVYIIRNIPRTTVKFWSKDIASFTLEREYDMKKLSIYEKVALLYGQGSSMQAIGDSLDPPIHRFAVARMLKRYLSLRFKELKECHVSQT